MKRSASVTAAAVVALAGSGLALLGAGLGAIGILFLKPQDLPQSGPMPVSVMTAALFGLAIFIGCGIWGIVTGIGLLRLRNWARISTLVWAGLMVFFSTLPLLTVLTVPLPAEDMREFIRIILPLFYGLPILIGVWWLILFNRRGTKEQFSPQLSGKDAAEEQTPRPPLAVTILAWIMIVSSGFSLLMFLYLYRFPFLLFGHRTGAMAGMFIYSLMSILTLTAGIGLLRLKRWSHPLAMGLQLFGLTSGIFSFLSPNFEAVVRESASKITYFPQGMDPAPYVRFGMMAAFIGFLLPALVLAILIYYRNSFLESAALAEKTTPR